MDSYNGNKRTVAAKATENVKLSGNLDAALEVTSSSGTDNAQSIVPVTVYDSLGKEYEINIEFNNNCLRPIIF